jgi:CTP:molybdopterin cytidylyltransferase MocA
VSLGVVIPAAGLGTRLEEFTRGGSKEMLPLGGLPALQGALLEAEAAGASQVIVVIGPGKTDLRRWLAGRRVLVTEQPEPVGTLDAVDRGRALLDCDRVAVVYPDMLHLPDQRGLVQVARAARDVPGTWYALVRRTPEVARRMGRNARVETEPMGGGRHRITAVHGGGVDEPALHTVLLELRCDREEELLAARRDEGDRALRPVLAQLADEGLLFGLELDSVLDVGVPAGYIDAVERFESGARWRS